MNLLSQSTNTMTSFEDEGRLQPSAKGRRPDGGDTTFDTSYFTDGECRKVLVDGRIQIQVKSSSPNAGPRHRSLGIRVCPMSECWWLDTSGELFSDHAESCHGDEPEWRLLLDPMQLFEELRPESPAPVYKKTKHVDRPD